MEISTSIQKYAWGKQGSGSLVAQLSKNVLNFEVSESEKYAELWIGTHPNGPSKLLDEDQSLDTFIKGNPAVLGQAVVDRFGPNLPFLLKILSVETALSIQAHPDLELAKKLHADRPDLYKDANHKPEMAIAITPFEIMCGFRNFQEIVKNLKNVPEFRRLIGDEAAAQLEANMDKASLKTAFGNLMNSDKDLLSRQLESLLSRLDESVENHDLIARLAAQFPGDVGIFGVFFLQHILLQPGEAVFLPANEPHACIFGDCAECMATSDNVVRAGLTPKFIDADTLVEMLTYDTGRDWIVKGKELNNGGTLYDTPIPEFSVVKYNVSEKFTLKPRETSCSVLLCTSGNGTCASSTNAKPIELTQGSCVFLPVRDEM
ncbi:unnamed protein product [Allacma fusca]|uniref:Phosphohexomutase n=2 Tax=Allacma fusca TaxID=39272 RepID=A0A8J2P432_9HEXA|nr:unnamed protein product [Allacma fusca]